MVKEKVEEMFNINDFIMEGGHVGLQCALLGPSGAGKSHMAGTLNGKTLYLCGSTERHGVKSAAKEAGSNLIPICWGQLKDGSNRSSDGAYKFLIQLLGDTAQLKKLGINNIVIDSAVDLMATIRNTQIFTNSCTTPKGAYDRWAEPDVYVDMFNVILDKLRNLQERENINFVVTFDLEVQEKDELNRIVQSKPRLPSFSVAERIIQQFPDIIMISKVKGKKEILPLVQMGAGCTRVGKDENGQVTKTIDFTPRLSDVEEIPQYIKADFKEILKLKGVE